MKKEVFKIHGMHCASCASNIERAVSDLVGVKTAQVNFGAETLLVEYDEAKITVQGIAKAVSGVGYKLLIPEARDILEQEKSEREKELKSLKRKVIIGAIFSAIIF